MPEMNFKKRTKAQDIETAMKTATRQLYNQNDMLSYQSETGKSSITAGVKYLQYYLEGNYALKLTEQALELLSQINPAPPEPNFELKNQKQLDDMNKISRNNYQSRVNEFVRDKTASWFSEHQQAVKDSLKDLTKQRQIFEKNLKDVVVGNPGLEQLRKAYKEEDDQTLKEDRAKVYVESVLDLAGMQVHPDLYKKRHPYAIDRIDMMQLAIANVETDSDSILSDIAYHEDKLRLLHNRKEALTAIKILFTPEDQKDPMIYKYLKELIIEVENMESEVELEGETLEEKVAARIEKRKEIKVNAGDKRQQRLKKYVSSACLREYREELVRNKNDVEREDDRTDAHYEIIHKKEWVKRFWDKKRRKARQITKNNEVEMNSSQEKNNFSMASFQYTVTLAEAKEIVDGANGFLYYEELKEHPGLYTIKATLPMETTQYESRNTKIKLNEFNPKKGYNIFARDMARLMENLLKMPLKVVSDKMAEYRFDFSDINDVKSYMKYLMIDENSLSEEEKEDIKHAVCFMDEYRLFTDGSQITSFFSFAERVICVEQLKEEGLKTKLREFLFDKSENRFPGISKDDREGFDVFARRYEKDEKLKASFEALLDRWAKGVIAQKDIELKKILEIKELKPNSKQAPVVNECRANADIFVRLGQMEKKKQLMKEGKSKEEAASTAENTFARMKYDYRSFMNPDKVNYYLKFLNKYYPSKYEMIINEKDSEKRAELYKNTMKALTTFEYHFIPKIGETKDSVLSIEGFAPEIWQIFEAPLTLHPAIGVYRKNGEELGPITDAYEQSHNPLSSIKQYYDNDKGVVNDDYKFLCFIGKMVVDNQFANL